MTRFQNMGKRSLAGRGVGRILRFGVKRGLRSVEVNPEDFRRQLASKHGLWVPNFARMQDVPIERLDEIARRLIRDAERLALAEGAGFGLGGMMTIIPDAGFLTAITLRLIQRLCLLYGFEGRGRNGRGLRQRPRREANAGKAGSARHGKAGNAFGCRGRREMGGAADSAG
jgi:EcsC protein family